MEHSIWAWVGFNVFILIMLGIDLGLFNRNAHSITYKEATTWSIVWITLALIFGAGVFQYLGSQKGLEYLTGYLIEKSLSVDNLFVFLLIFSYFKVPGIYQHRVLFWGVLGALIMRAAMIFLGATLINNFSWIIYVFGGFLVYTGIKMFSQKETEIHPEENTMLRLVRRFVPITNHYDGAKFFTRVDGRLHGTLLLMVLVIVEATDLVFAVDSIPAIFAVTRDTFIVYTSNVFAILGLRSLYFLLAGVIEKFHYLKVGLAIVLTFIGVKMLVVALGVHIPIAVSLGVVALVLVGSVIASIIWPSEAETHIEVDLPPGFGPSPFDEETGSPVEAEPLEEARHTGKPAGEHK